MPVSQTIPRKQTPSADTIAAALIQHDGRQLGSMLFLLLGGLFLLPLGPALAASMTYAFAARRGSPDWIQHFLIWSLILIPLGFALSRSGGNKAINESAEQFGEYNFLVRRQMAWLFILKIFCVAGPALLWKVVRQSNSRKLHAAVSRQRAGEVLASLIKFDRGVDPLTLLHAHEALDDLLPVLAYLIDIGWLDMSKIGDRVWPTFAVKKELGLEL